MSIIWAELGLVRDLEFLLYPTNQQLQSPSLNPPVGIVLVFPPAPPPLKWLQLTCGWGESGVAWRESPVRLGPLPHKITWSPPLLFFQGFRLAKSGLMRAAFTCHHHHIHKSSCCFPTSVSEVLNFPSPSSTSPLKVQRAWDQVRMPLWFSPPPLWLPFYVRGHFVFWFPALPHFPPLSRFIPL